jgi:hypothetical protein
VQGQEDKKNKVKYSRIYLYVFIVDTAIILLKKLNEIKILIFNLLNQNGKL